MRVTQLRSPTRAAPKVNNDAGERQRASKVDCVGTSPQSIAGHEFQSLVGWGRLLAAVVLIVAGLELGREVTGRLRQLRRTTRQELYVTIGLGDLRLRRRPTSASCFAHP